MGAPGAVLQGTPRGRLGAPRGCLATLSATPFATLGTARGLEVAGIEHIRRRPRAALDRSASAGQGARSGARQRSDPMGAKSMRRTTILHMPGGLTEPDSGP